MLAVDHLILAVPDADAAARALEQRHGLASVAGGRHRGHGTGNRIVPLGTAYLELMEVVDAEEARTSPLGSWLLATAVPGGRLAALCLRTDDLDAVAARLDLQPLAMSRRTPEGRELSWRLAGLDAMLDRSLPFFIEWHGDPALHPGRTAVRHRTVPEGIAWVELGGDPGELRGWLGDGGLPVRLVGGRRGVRRAAIAVEGGEIVLGNEPV